MKKILKASIVGYQDGKPLKFNYRAVLSVETGSKVPSFNGRLVLGIEHQGPSGLWGATPGSWYVESLLGLDGFSRGPIGDEVAIDFGQNWTVRGMREALREAVGL